MGRNQLIIIFAERLPARADGWRDQTQTFLLFYLEVKMILISILSILTGLTIIDVVFRIITYKQNIYIDKQINKLKKRHDELINKITPPWHEMNKKLATAAHKIRLKMFREINKENGKVIQ